MQPALLEDPEEVSFASGIHSRMVGYSVGRTVAVVDDGGEQREMVRYSAYGIPFGLPAGDVDSDGDNDSADHGQIQTWINGSTYDVRGDIDLDGDVDSTDHTLASSSPLASASLGWGELSSFENVLGGSGRPRSGQRSYNVRNRWMLDMGTWSQRDPLGYVDGSNLYEGVVGRPMVAVDPMGLNISWEVGGAINKNPYIMINAGGGPGIDIEQDGHPGDTNSPPVTSGGAVAEGGCGPDVTEWLETEMHMVGAWADARAGNYFQGLALLKNFGGQLTHGTSDFSSPDCPQSKKCGGTVTVCGVCVDRTEVGNMVYGAMAAAAGVDDESALIGPILTPGVNGPDKPADRAAVLAGWDWWNRRERSGALCKMLKAYGPIMQVPGCAPCAAKVASSAHTYAGTVRSEETSGDLLTKLFVPRAVHPPLRRRRPR